MTKQKNTTKPKKPFYKSKKFMILAVIIAIPVIYIGWYMISQKIALYQDQQRFLSGKQAVEKLAGDLKVKLPQYEWITQSTCLKQTKLLDVYIDCGSHVIAIAKISSSQQGNATIDSVDNVLRTQKQFVQTNSSVRYPDVQKYISNEFDKQYGESSGIHGYGGSYMEASHKLGCSMNYTIAAQDLQTKMVDLKMSFDCSDSALDLWFN